MPLTLTADAEHFIELDEVKRQANVSSSASDDELELFRGAAEDAVEGLIGPVRHRAVTEVHRSTTYGGTTVLLREWPALSVDEVTVGGTSVSHTVNAGAGIVDVRAFGDVIVTYTVGRAVVPDAVRVAALIIAAHLWATQLGSGPSQFADDTGAPVPGMAYSIPNRATDLLRPYLLPPAVG